MEQPALSIGIASVDENGAVRGVGRDFARTWVSRATVEEVQRLVDQYPVIPKEIDAGLLAEVRTRVGIANPLEEQRKRARKAFWREVRGPTADPHRPGTGVPATPRRVVNTAPVEA
jgi:hypothetical protein